MLRRDIAAHSLIIVCKHFIPVKGYGKTIMTVFCIKSVGTIQVVFNFFWQVNYRNRRINQRYMNVAKLGRTCL